MNNYDKRHCMNNYDKVEPNGWYIFTGGHIYRGDEVPAGLYHPNHDKLGNAARRRRLTVNDIDMLRSRVEQALARTLVSDASMAERAIREIRGTGERPVGLRDPQIIFCEECLNYVIPDRPTGHCGSCSHFPGD